MYIFQRPVGRILLGLGLLLVAAGVWLVARTFDSGQGSISPSGDPNGFGFAGPIGAGSIDATLQFVPTTAPPVPDNQPHEGDHVRPTSFDGDVRSLPQVGPTDKHAMSEPESPAWERRITKLQPGLTFADPVRQVATSPLAMPSPGQNFTGLDFASWGDGWPPDTNGDVGPNHYIQTVNTSIGIYNKTGTRLAAFTFNSFFSGAAAPCNTSNNGDPVVVYDASVDRWIITDFAWTNTQNGPYYECIAASKSGDPVSGGWWLYTFRTDDASHPWLNDYPKLGVWQDGIYMSANMFDCLNSTCSSANYMGVRVWALNRSDLISGAALRSIFFDMNNTAFGALLPANYRGTPPPAGENEFFAAVDSPNQFHLWKFHTDWVLPANSTFSGPSNIVVANFAWPSANVPQAGTSNRLDTLGDRLMMQLQYRNLGGTEALWASHTAASGGVTGVRWYEIQSPNSAPTVFQQGTYQPDSTFRWMPSLAVDGNGNMAIGYSASSASLNPQIRYAGRLTTDALGVLGQGETTLIAGTDSQKNTCGGAPCQRWGDYSAMTVDPVDDCTFWYTSEYYESGGGTTGNWQTRVGSFTYPTCSTGPTATPTFTSTGPTPTASNSPTATSTGTATVATATPTHKGTAAPTSTRTPTATSSSPTATSALPSDTPTNTPPGPTATHTPTATATRKGSPVPPTSTRTPTATPTGPTPTPTNTPLVSPSPTRKSSP